MPLRLEMSMLVARGAMRSIDKFFALLFLLATACTDTADKLSRIGKAPPLSEVRNPQEDPSYKNLT